MKTITLALTLVLLATGCSAPQTQKNENTQTAQAPKRTLYPTKTIAINGHELRVQIAKTAEEQAQGLSGITNIGENEGMLFPFDPPSKPTFWMRGMLFPIDILWIRDGKVIGIEQNIQPPLPNQPLETLTKYFPPSQVDSVLETRAGLSADAGFGVDSLVMEK